MAGINVDVHVLGNQDEEENIEMDIEVQPDDGANDDFHDMGDDELMKQHFTAVMTPSNVNNTCHGAVRLSYSIFSI